MFLSPNLLYKNNREYFLAELLIINGFNDVSAILKK